MSFYEDWDAKRGVGASDSRTPAKHLSDTTTAYGRQALDEELERLRLAHEGERNNTLNVVAFAVFQLVDAGHVDEREAYEQLDTVAQSKGLTRSEIARTMASARGAAGRKRRSNVPTPFEWARIGAESVDLSFDPSQFQGVVDPFAHLYLPRSALGELPEAEPLIDDTLDKRTIVMLVGRDQSYKSFIALSWAACVATGKPWQGKPVQQGRALVIVGEGAFGLDDRIKAWEQCFTAVPDDALHIRREPVNVFKQGDAFAWLMHRAEVEQYDLIILDTLQRMTSGAEHNSAKDAGIIVGALDRLRRASDATVLVVAHSGKSDIDARGSSALEDDLDMVWRVKLDEDKRAITLWLDKRKDGPATSRYELFPRLIPGTKSLVLQEGSPLAEQPPEHHLELLKLLADAGSGGESKSTLADVLGLSMRKLYMAANYLEKNSLAVRLKSGQRSYWEITGAGLSALEQIGETRGDLHEHE